MSLFANTRFAFSLFACAALACAQETEPLCAAAARRDLAEVRRLLDRGANPDARDSKGRTALILAMQGSASEYKVVPPSEDIARILIERGAAINVRDTEGWTPLLMLLAQFA